MAKHAGHSAAALALAGSLAALAGFVDATGFVYHRGLFVSFMSGNTTQAAVALARTTLGGAEIPAFADFARTVVLFVAGAVLAELLAAASGRRWHLAVLALECALLAAALLVLLGSGGAGSAEWAIASLLALAMGAQNGALHGAGGLKVGLTYVTGMLVSLARGLAAALRGAGGWREPAEYAGIWAGLAVGGFAGALVASRSVPAALAVALGAALALLAAAAALERFVRDGLGDA